jgi:molybdate transport system substrate-binding protein
MLKSLATFCIGSLLSTLPVFARDAHITVSAAISLKPALLALQPAYEKQSGDSLSFNFASSGVLMGQIKAGAPVDVFISAADKQMDELSSAGLIDKNTRKVIAQNQLVLIAPAGAPHPPASLANLANPAVKRIAIGQPSTVPAGAYAMQTLKNKGLDATLKPKLILATNVRQVLDYVVRGEVDAGLVYATDAKDAGAKVKVIEAIDDSAHEPIVYPGAVIKDSANAPAGKRFMDYLISPQGEKSLAVFGFAPAAEKPSTAPAQATETADEARGDQPPVGPSTLPLTVPAP